MLLNMEHQPILHVGMCNHISFSLPHSRVHRHLLSVFARGPEPVEPDSGSSSQTSVEVDRTDQEELLSDS